MTQIAVHHAVIPIPCKPWSLNGLSERLVVSHYENDYGGEVRTLNHLRGDLAMVAVSRASPHLVRAPKLEESRIADSVALHELYFGALGGDGGATFTGTGLGKGIDETISRALDLSF